MKLGGEKGAFSEDKLGEMEAAACGSGEDSVEVSNEMSWHYLVARSEVEPSAFVRLADNRVGLSVRFVLPTVTLRSRPSRSDKVRDVCVHRA